MSPRQMGGWLLRTMREIERRFLALQISVPSDRRSDTFERSGIFNQFRERLPTAAANLRSFPIA